MMNFNDETMFHIALKPSQGAEYAIITGDPGRVESIAKLLDHPCFVASNREFTTWAGELNGHRVLVTSHGIGGPSLAICVEELSRCGVRTVIRVGTCGGMALQVCGGDLVVCTGAIRAEGTSREYLPVEFPAVADPQIVGALTQAANANNAVVHAGVVHCKDSFYGQHCPENSPVYYDLLNRWDSWMRGGCLASEMEGAALFILGASLGIRTGCILHVIWNQEREKAGLPNIRNDDTSLVRRTVVDAMRRLIPQD